MLECFEENAVRAAAAVSVISRSGRAPKNDAAIFALALGAEKMPTELLSAAVGDVCRTGTHLFQFVQLANEYRGWGKSLKAAVGAWYAQRPAAELEYQITKYRQRNGMSHRDVLRLAHPVAETPEHATLYRWIVAGKEELGERVVTRRLAGGRPPYDGAAPVTYPEVGPLSPYMEAFEELQSLKADSVSAARTLIHAYGFGHEHVPGDLLAKPEIWEALALHMPTGALLRNLAKLTAVGVLGNFSEAAKAIAARIDDESALKKARIHPVSVLMALCVYKQGHGDKGKLAWEPNPMIVDALDVAFYKSFATIVPTGKRILIALDVSGSMYGNAVPGAPGLTAAEASACMAMATVRSEENYHVLGFSNELVRVDITKTMSLADVVTKMRSIPMGGTDCALPMWWALKNKVPVDAFVTYTDSETWAGAAHPHQRLKEYRDKMGIAAKMVVCGVASTDFTIADPNDAGSLDCVGFDSSTPAILADFIRG